MSDWLLALFLSTALAALALWRHALTKPACALSWALAVCITYIGGVPAFLALAATFVFTIISGRLFPSRRKAAESVNHKTGRRDAFQIICNVSVAAACLITYSITGQEAFIVAFGAAMAASLADSMASEIGVLSTSIPVDICTGKTIAPGLSGGVTALGLTASFLGCAIIAAVYSLSSGFGLLTFSVIALCGFLASLFDSFLGSLLQVKYRCSVCGKITEKPVHCGEDCAVAGGIRWISNDMVNLSNNLFSACAAYLIWSLIT